MAGTVDILERTLAPDELSLVRGLAQRLHQHYGERLERVAVFGSRARGDTDEESDIDLIVVLRVPISEEAAETRLTWDLALELQRARRLFLPLSILVFAEERFAEMRERERRFALDVEAEGIRL